jgi:glycosyltransferase involved in cell wall biosynthesis
MITELSILIPSYNSICIEMVKRLHAQCCSIAQPFQFEMIVADDGSTDPEVVKANKAIEQLESCTFLCKESNTGSAATRNYLAQHARYEWLLFLDCDMTVPDSRFVERYLRYTTHDVVNGGISIGKGKKSNLRYLYEHHAERRHTAEMRNKAGFKEFRSTNFLIKRALILQYPFDERFKHSGYEDVLFGKTLSLKGASILHINNPLVLDNFEDNNNYMQKCERNLRTLYQFQDELQGYSRLLDLANRLPRPLVRYLHRHYRLWERRLLTGNHPSLLLFNLYRLGYFLSIRSPK